MFQFLYGLSLPLQKYIFFISAPFFATGIRMVFAGIGLLSFAVFIQKCNYVGKDNFWIYIRLIFCGMYGKYLLRSWALLYLPVAKIAFLFLMTPFITVLVSSFWYKEKLLMQQWIGLLLGFGGVLSLIILKTPTEFLYKELCYVSLPELALCGSILFHVYSMITISELINKKKESPIIVNGVRMFGGGLLLLITSFLTEDFLPVTHASLFIVLTMMLIFMSNCISNYWYVLLFKKYSITFISLMDFVHPLTTAFYGWIFFGEIITWHYLVSASIIFSGLYLFNQKKIIC